MIFDNVSKQFLNMNPNQIGSETERYVVLDAEQEARLQTILDYNEMVKANNENPANPKLYEKRIDVKWVLTDEETEKTLAELKAEKKRLLDIAHKAEIEKGYTYNTWNYPISDNTVNNIIKQETLIKIAERKSVTIDSFQLTDGSGVDRTFTAEQYYDFALGYAIVTAKIEKWYSNRRNAIENAQNGSELDVISTDFPTE